MKFSTASALFTLVAATAAAPAPQSFPTGSGILRPTTRSQYEVWTGAVHYKTPTGKIFKDGRTTDITTLITFVFPDASQGKTCELHFFLDSSATVSGTGQFDVFTSLAPATQDTTTWPSGNLRDQYGGRLSVSKPGEATWVADIPVVAKTFPCPAGSLIAGEFVPTGDADDIEWNGATAGAYIKYY